MRGAGFYLSKFKENILSFITLCTLIFIYHMFYTAGSNVVDFLNYISKTNSVRVYFKSDAQINIDEIYKKAGEIKGVAEIKYYTPAKAKEFAIANAPNINNLKSFPEDLFPAFIELIPVKDNNKKILANIEKQASALPNAESVSYGKEFLGTFLTIKLGTWLFLIIMSLLFALSIIFVVWNTTKLSLYKLKEEIQLYSLVGATRPFIMIPYVVSSFLHGLIAYLFATLFFILVSSIFSVNIQKIFDNNMSDTINISYFIITFLCICLVSIASAMFSVISFLRRIPSINEN